MLYRVGRITVDWRANNRHLLFSKRKTSVKRRSSVAAPYRWANSLVGFGFIVSCPITIPTLPVIAVP